MGQPPEAPDVVRLDGGDASRSLRRLLVAHAQGEASCTQSTHDDNLLLFIYEHSCTAHHHVFKRLIEGWLRRTRTYSCYPACPQAGA